MDHPRSRGEYFDILRAIVDGAGSSPLSRGIPLRPDIAAALGGIIPALAGNTSSAGWGGLPRGDHPRSRGEYTPQGDDLPTECGSSPLSRGIRQEPIDEVLLPRIIPALAGNTGPCRPRCRAIPDHPRSRGEYQVEMLWLFNRNGSSPLSRGIQLLRGGAYGFKRIIPALAGNTWLASVSVSAQQDHPRSRGEYGPFSGAGVNHNGSSPLSRGIRPSPARRSVSLRIIPALAGNTVTGPSFPPAAGDHPRSRGEYQTEAADALDAYGSSPLSRGIPWHRRPGFPEVRIIPALAGNTTSRPARCCWTADHPRSRGEYPGADPQTGRQRGSSPLSRGIPCDTVRHDTTKRIIPALAGNTFQLNARHINLRDHPRSRGEYPVPKSVSGSTAGSSPLSRGIRVGPLGRHQSVRIIPALAGNTPAEPRNACGSADHPRSRGEYRRGFGEVGVVTGSSPLSRGIPFPVVRRSGLVRIIPALAGNTHDPQRVQRQPGDHPRSRGEYGNGPPALHGAAGSSPLSRGILGRGRRPRTGERIIPALAGNTRLVSPSPPHPEDHPRSRGEYTALTAWTYQAMGSSPLSRGIPRSRASAVTAAGIIPALAGNTGSPGSRRDATTDHPRSRGEYPGTLLPTPSASGSSPLSRGIQTQGVR